MISVDSCMRDLWKWNGKLRSCLRKGYDVGIEIFCKSGIGIVIEESEIEIGLAIEHSEKLELELVLKFERN